MATTITKTIGATGDYPDLQSWFNAAPADLTVADQIWRGECQNQEFTSASTLLYINGKTTDAARYFELTTVAGASFQDHASKATNPLRYDVSKGAGLRVTADFAAPIRISSTTPYTRISKLQLTSTSNTTSTWPTVFTQGATLADVNQCLIEGFCANSSLPGVVSLYGAGAVVRNSVVVQKTSTTSANIAYIGNGAEIHNCTLVSLGATLTVGIATEFSAIVVKNTYIGGCTTLVSGGSAPTVTNSATSATASGFTTVPMSTATFQNVTAGTHDLRLAAGSALIDAGTTDTTYAAVGILGTARPQGSAYDIGAYEYVAGAAAATGVTMTGPTTGSTGSPSTNFAVGVTPVGGTITGTVVVTPSDGGAGGTFTPATVSLTSGAPTANFTYTAATAGAKTISVTNNGSLANPSNITYTASSAAATATVVSGPASGVVAVQSTNFTASANGIITGTVVITPSDGGAGGTFAPATVSISAGAPTGTFKYTAASLDAKTISFTNNGGLANQASLTYTGVADTTAPTQPGPITPGTITSTSLAFTYPAASDNDLVSVVQISKDGGGTWGNNGTGLAGSFAGLTPDTPYTIAVRAGDRANPVNYSTPITLVMRTSAAATGSFVGEQMGSAGTLLANQPFTAEWHAGGVIGSSAGTVTYHSGTLSATGIPTISGMATGPGYGIFVSGPSIAYQAGTVA